MSLRLSLLERWLPRALRRRMFSRLVRETARAFDAAAPDLRRLPMDEAVAAFACFTRAEAVRVLREGGPEVDRVRTRLHDAARELGTSARRAAGLRTRDDGLRALRLLYAAIGIDLEADRGQGDLTITRCAFSALYTPEVCSLVSALDAGLVDGLAGGASLSFTDRITDGAPRCRARLSWGPPS